MADIRARLEKVVAGLEFNRGTHVIWRDWLRKDPANATVNPHAGDAEFHDMTITEYDEHLAAVRDAIKALAPTHPSPAPLEES